MRGQHKTDIEEIMEKALKKEEIKFVPQYPIRGKFGYILDFAIPDLKINIEADGEVWHTNKYRDNKRNWVLRNKGWKVIRFSGTEIKEELDKCISQVHNLINERRNELDGKIPS